MFTSLTWNTFIVTMQCEQGALGGDTYINIYENNTIDTLIFKISKDSQKVYHGNWDDFMNMEIYLKDNYYLVINSVEYTIK